MGPIKDISRVVTAPEIINVIYTPLPGPSHKWTLKLSINAYLIQVLDK